jgi:hypothetical protein
MASLKSPHGPPLPFLIAEADAKLEHWAALPGSYDSPGKTSVIRLVRKVAPVSHRPTLWVSRNISSVWITRMYRAYGPPLGLT